MARQHKPRKLARTELINTVQQGFASNDEVRLAGLKGLLKIRTKKAMLREREIQRLDTKYQQKTKRGDIVESRQEANRDLIGGLKMEINRVVTKPLKLNTKSWALQGYVYDRNAVPVPNAKVVLYNLDEQEVKKVTATTTDANGKYVFEYDAKDNEIIDFTEELATLAAIRKSAAQPEDVSERTVETERVSVTDRLSPGISEKATVFARAYIGKKKLSADSLPLLPRPGMSHYRDIIFTVMLHEEKHPVSNQERRATRYLGNSSSRELHDLHNEQVGCNIDRTRFDHSVNFKTDKDALEAGYDYCAYCFGKKKSKR